jgi:hypothetical protein
MATRLAVVAACVMTGHELTRLQADEQAAADQQQYADTTAVAPAASAGVGNNAVRGDADAPPSQQQQQQQQEQQQQQQQSYCCGHYFWAWKSSPVPCDRSRDRRVGFYTADDVKRWEHGRLSAVRFCVVCVRGFVACGAACIAGV